LLIVAATGVASAFRRTSIALFAVLVLNAACASAQDLFELEVFEYETAAAGQHDVELHTNVMSSGGVVPAVVSANHKPAHISVEFARGWHDRFETALFVQTAPFGSRGSAWFAGGHARAKVRLGTLPRVPLRVGVSAEYAFNRAAFDHELQTFEVRSIVDYRHGRLLLIANPTIEVVTHGSEEGLEPVFDISARAGWRVVDRVVLTTDYFSAAATTRHLQPEASAHHLMFGGVDLDLGSGWEMELGAGHCLTRHEPWVMKSTLGFRF
jgi:hypothetical protein